MNDMEKMGYRDLFIKHKDKIDARCGHNDAVV